MGDLRLRIFDRRPPEFWVAMGPFFASDRIRRELPYLRDEPARIWLLALAGDAVHGFLAMEQKGAQGYIHALWIAPPLRGTSGLARSLVGTAEQYLVSIGCDALNTTANGRSRAMFAGLGFAETQQRGSYTIMHKEISDGPLLAAGRPG